MAASPSRPYPSTMSYKNSAAGAAPAIPVLELRRVERLFPESWSRGRGFPERGGAARQAVSAEHGQSGRHGVAGRAGDQGAVGDAGQGVAAVSLALYPGEVLALLGPSGCGKTTTLRLLAGYERPDAGEVWIDGRLVATPANVPHAVWAPPEQRHLGMVFQDYALFPHLTAAENVDFGLRRLSRRERTARVGSLLNTVGLASLGDRYPHQLSGGQQQRVALARALAPRPRAVLLDEPFNTLDVSLREQVRRDLLAILRAEGVAVLLVTHDQVEALTCADRIAIMRAGRVEQIDTPSALYNRPATRFVASFVGEGSFLPATIAGGALETSFGAVSVTDPAVWLLSGVADLLVRPEEVLAEPDPQGNARVAFQQSRGADVDYDLTVRSARDTGPSTVSNVILHTHAPIWVPPGAPVRATIQLRHLVLFQGHQAVLTRCLTPNCTCPSQAE